MNANQGLPTAAAVMQRAVITLEPDQAVTAALQTLLQNRISGAPVVHTGRVVGMFSERDALAALAASAYESEPTGTVRQHMRASFVSVAPSTDLFLLADLFGQHPIRRFPVVDGDGALLGLVMRGDVLAALQRLVERPVRTEPRTAYERVAEHLA